MIKSKELKIYIEDTNQFKKKMKKELNYINNNKTKKITEDSISFQSLEQLRTFLTPKRIELLRTIRHKEPKSIYELAKIVNRTTENVNTDVKLLKNLGFVKLKKVEENRIKVIPMVSYDKMTLEIDV